MKIAASNSSGPLTIPDTTLAINSAQPMSQRVVHYEIDAKYDAAKHTVDATETLTYRNLTGVVLDHFPFHLYQNAFQPNATWVREAKVAGSRDIATTSGKKRNTDRKKSRALKWWARAILLRSCATSNPTMGTKTTRPSSICLCPSQLHRAHTSSSRLRFRPSFRRRRRAPDGSAISCWAGNGSRRSACGGMEPGTAINITPTEFFADFGVYDVKLTVPQFEVVGASGVKVGEVNNPTTPRRSLITATTFTTSPGPPARATK
jgi:hypothetical protein